MLALPPGLDVVIGVDTHKDTHTAAAVSGAGAVLEHLTVPADAAGYGRLIGFGGRHGATLWAVEGTGSFGRRRRGSSPRPRSVPGRRPSNASWAAARCPRSRRSAPRARALPRQAGLL